MRRKNGQSVMEYTILIIIVMGALLLISNYVKRGIQGRYKEAVDSVGEQYDPLRTEGSIKYSLTGETTTEIKTEDVIINGVNMVWTLRTDTSNVMEKKDGDLTVNPTP